MHHTIDKIPNQMKKKICLAKNHIQKIKLDSEKYVPVKIKKKKKNMRPGSKIKFLSIFIVFFILTSKCRG